MTFITINLKIHVFFKKKEHFNDDKGVILDAKTCTGILISVQFLGWENESVYKNKRKMKPIFFLKVEILDHIFFGYCFLSRITVFLKEEQFVMRKNIPLFSSSYECKI